MAGARISDRVWAAVELLSNAPWLVLRARGQSYDLEPATRELERSPTDVEHAMADHVREPPGYQHSECSGHYVLRAEAALLVLGVALLIWQWRHPAAFLMLLSGIGVLFVGGTLVLYPNSSPPMLAHWTPAFPAFYAAIAIPIGAWAASARVAPQQRWIRIGVVAAGLLVLGYANIRFYFFNYHADPDNLKNDRYKRSQTLYDIQTVQSRYIGALGNAYRVIVVGKSPYPYDPEITRYLVQGQEYVPTYDPQTQSAPARVAGKGLTFLFFPGNEQYEHSIREQYPGGTPGEVRNQMGRHLFHTYVVAP